MSKSLLTQTSWGTIIRAVKASKALKNCDFTMSTILSIDTATDTCDVALVGKTATINRSEILPRARNQHIMGMIEAVLNKRQLKNTIDYIACDIGPGSFTGLRVGVSVTQGLAWTLDVLVLPYCSLEAQATKLSYDRNLDDGDFILSTIDAKVGEFYYRWFVVQAGSVRALTQASISSCAKLKFSPNHTTRDKIWIIGDGSDLTGLTKRPLTEVLRSVAPSALTMATEFSKSPYLNPIEPELLEPKYVQGEARWKKLGVGSSNHA